VAEATEILVTLPTEQSPRNGKKRSGNKSLFYSFPPLTGQNRSPKSIIADRQLATVKVGRAIRPTLRRKDKWRRKMSVRDIIRWGRSDHRTPSIYRDPEQSPFLALHREVNRLFDDVFRGFELPLPMTDTTHWAGVWPNVDIAETDKEIHVSAEIPGLEEKDVEILLQEGMLILRGEKHKETVDKEHNFSECFSGHFERRIPVGKEIEENKVTASFKNGVLQVTLPKTERAQTKPLRIAINTKQ
jgi:HSP20 family protein